MSDLISRQALKEKLHFMFKWYGRLPCSEEDKCIQRTIKRCMVELDKAPTIDAVEVVRCGECINCRAPDWFCRVNDFYIKSDDFFCKEGQREVSE